MGSTVQSQWDDRIVGVSHSSWCSPRPLSVSMMTLLCVVWCDGVLLALHSHLGLAPLAQQVNRRPDTATPADDDPNRVHAAPHALIRIPGVVSECVDESADDPDEAPDGRGDWVLEAAQQHHRQEHRQVLQSVLMRTLVAVERIAVRISEFEESIAFAAGVLSARDALDGVHVGIRHAISLAGDSDHDALEHEQHKGQHNIQHAKAVACVKLDDSHDAVLLALFRALR
mmetsp:Transcript_36543/g.91465  ORF Transcript_36543/g.91465 Transcript_36543/m.91465 type:complete len:228 (-) Transcript_36543:343-1026(-)